MDTNYIPIINQYLAIVVTNRADSLYLKANEAVKKAERYDPNSIFTHFYVYKIAVLEKNTLKGKTPLCFYCASECVIHLFKGKEKENPFVPPLPSIYQTSTSCHKVEFTTDIFCIELCF